MGRIHCLGASSLRETERERERESDRETETETETQIDKGASSDPNRLRQCVDHPLLVLSKVTEEDGAEDKLLEGDGGGDASGSMGSLRQMIAKYAGGGAAGVKDDSGNVIGSGNGNGTMDIDVDVDVDVDGDTVPKTNDADAYALNVLKEIEEAEGTSECMVCTSEIFDEVLLPCYHRG